MSAVSPHCPLSAPLGGVSPLTAWASEPWVWLLWGRGHAGRKGLSLEGWEPACGSCGPGQWYRTRSCRVGSAQTATPRLSGQRWARRPASARRCWHGLGQPGSAGASAREERAPALGLVLLPPGSCTSCPALLRAPVPCPPCRAREKGSPGGLKQGEAMVIFRVAPGLSRAHRRQVGWAGGFCSPSCRG